MKAPSPPRTVVRTFSVALACMLGSVVADGANAQESWNPFNDLTPPVFGARRPQNAPEARPAPGETRATGFEADGAGAAVTPQVRDAVERTDLTPLPPPADAEPVGGVSTPATADAPNPGPPGRDQASGRAASQAALPLSVDQSSPAAVARIAALTRLSADVAAPTRSAALAGLLIRVVGPRGGSGSEAVEALGQRSVLLYRAGLVQAAHGVVASVGDPAGAKATPAISAFAALRTRLALAVGDRERGCAGAVALMQMGAELPASIRAEGIAAQGYCGAAAGNPAAAGLAASLGREAGGMSAGTLAALDAVAAGVMPALASFPVIGLIDWRLSEVVGKFDGPVLPPERFEPAALVAAGSSAVAPPRLRITAAEAAAKINAIDAIGLAEAYRGAGFPAVDLAQPQTARVDAWARRALLFKAAEGERTPSKRTRLVRAALDDARRAGLFVPVAAAFAPVVEEIRPVPEVGWFAETAVEVLFAGGRFDEARRWAQFGMQPGVTGDRAALSLAHWLALIDIADAGQIGRRSQALGFVEDLALRGRFSSEALHRLATVLDALDYDVPVRLWEAASRAPQPTTGHLPATGILTDLQDAAKARDHVRVVGLVFRALGPGGPEGAHMIALGDAIRALKRAGLEAEARQIAGEALFALWPRSSTS